MKEFLGDDFLLETKTAEQLYHDYAAKMPIIDYHNHLPPKEICGNGNFENLTQAWLYGDHYKWRAMRTNGIAEKYCTGDVSDYEKFEKWAETVPYTLRNPLYHWTHLELRRYFGVNEILDSTSAQKIYDECSAKLRTKNYSIQSLLAMQHVEVVCTTDDPLDNLEYHKIMAQREGDLVKMYPAFRPDRFLQSEKQGYAQLIKQLGELTEIEINNISSFEQALEQRLQFFNDNGCSLSDHGLNYLPNFTLDEKEANRIFKSAIASEWLSQEDHELLQGYMLLFLCRSYAKMGWVQQFHVGAMRNNNSRAMRTLGPDTGWDSIGDWPQAMKLSRFMAQLDRNDELAKTVIYNLNPADNEVMATMIGNFNDGSAAGKIQWGSGWWFLDQKKGMEDQLETLSQMGLVSKFVGMLTDSRSFLSFPRHEYFRRILCNLFGKDIENGELPNDINWVGKVIQDICYNNTKNYFQF